MDSIPTILPVQPDSTFVGQRAYVLETTNSTNRFATNLLNAKIRPIEGTVILTREQTAGRGQFGTSWESAPGLNVAMSVIFYPEFLHPADSVQLNAAICVAVLNGIRSLIKKDFDIKWPNDIWFEGKKLAGILVESSIQGQRLKDVIAGVGVNVNQLAFDPALPNPGSMTQISGLEYNVAEVAARICEAMEQQYLQLRAGKGQEIMEAFHSHLLGLNRNCGFRTAENLEFEGFIRGVDRHGRLLVETEKELHVFELKQVELLSVEGEALRS